MFYSFHLQEGQGRLGRSLFGLDRMLVCILCVWPEITAIKQGWPLQSSPLSTVAGEPPVAISVRYYPRIRKSGNIQNDVFYSVIQRTDGVGVHGV